MQVIEGEITGIEGVIRIAEFHRAGASVESTASIKNWLSSSQGDGEIGGV